MPPEPPADDSTQKTDAEDGGWSVESHSATADPTPADTTAGVVDEEPPPATGSEPPSPSDDAGGDESGEQPTPPAADAPASRAAAGGKPTAEGKKPAAEKGKKKDTWQHRVDRLTQNLRTQERLNADLQTRLDALERGRTAPAPSSAAPEPKPPADKPATGPERKPMPEPPRYLDYQTDDEYTAAMTKWRTDVATWQTEQETRLKTEITGELDQRLTRQQQEAAARRQQEAIASRFAEMHEAHPDFHKLVEANADALDSVKSVFLQDVVINTEDGGEFLYDLASDPDLALALGELPLPTRPLADAIKSSPAIRPLMKFFGTPEGREAFIQLRRLPAPRVMAEVGKLEVRLDAADSGPARGAREPITSAIPPAKPPAGTPRARQAPATTGAQSFEDWMAAEDRREAEEKRAHLKSIGLSV